MLLIVVGALLAGRRDEPLPTVYGRRRGGEAGRSVNGTAVLADMFRARGHTVTTMSRFSPRLDKYDVVVWTPDDFEPPDEEHRERLEQWLMDGKGRTVVYIGRDYNAAIDYWERMAPTAPPELAGESLHRQAEARAAWESARSQMPNGEYARWFTARRDHKRRKVTELSGPWAKDIDASQTDIHVEGQLDVPTEDDRKNIKDAPELPTKFEPLLKAGDDPIAFRVMNETGEDDPDDDWRGGQIIVLTNGSFVLNYPLVNREHRKLANKLIDECGQGDKRVVFIESAANGPPILDKEPTGSMPSPLELLKVWPLNVILLHIAVLGIIVCLSRSLIFGRPRDLPGDSPSDFGKHVAALGKLLARTKDRNYAQARLAQYRQVAERRSGRSHLKNK
ncbi:MAG: hypothetical protein JF612_02860 [Planctomycetia bacterium]|nr:hypothetical protein [Planctomycetia bacterium]